MDAIIVVIIAVVASQALCSPPPARGGLTAATVPLVALAGVSLMWASPFSGSLAY